MRGRSGIGSGLAHDAVRSGAPTMVKELDFESDAASELRCPYCGEVADVDVDPGGANEQSFEQDCAVCCRPWRVHVTRDEGGEETVTLERENE
jgi:hypothetical protein